MGEGAPFWTLAASSPAGSADPTRRRPIDGEASDCTSGPGRPRSLPMLVWTFPGSRGRRACPPPPIGTRERTRANPAAQDALQPLYRTERMTHECRAGR